MANNQGGGRNGWWVWSLVIGAVVTAIPRIGFAQITPDETLGEERSRVTPNVGVRGGVGDRIEGGARRGANLFHSFATFNVGNGQRVYFSNPSGIQNILSRVTGTDVSNIRGTLGVDGAANLFLLNPNGIIFGPNARLDISGSFVASGGDRFTFPDGGEFSAVNPQAPPLLAVNVPLGLQYGNGNRHTGSTILNRGNLTAGQDLTLAAGHLDLQGQLQAGRDLTLWAQNTVQIRDTVAIPFLARSGRNLTIQGNQRIDILALNHSQTPIVSGANLNLISNGTVSGDAHFASAGNFNLLRLNGNPGTFISLYDPVIRANGDVTFGNYTGVALKVEATGSITGGNIRITGADTAIPATDPDYAILSRERSVILRAGLASIADPNLPQIGVGTPPTDFAAGRPTPDQPAGSITVGTINTSDRVAVGDAGNGGAIILQATGNIQTGNLTSISASDDSGNTGNGGAITLSTTGGSISTGELRSYSRVFSGPGNSGNGGAITFIARGSISIGNFGMSYSASENGTSGNGGAITLTTTGGNISAEGISLSSVSDSASGSGSGGAITLTAMGGGIIAPDLFSDSNSNSGNSGSGGAITLTAMGGGIIALDLFSDSGSNSGNSGNGGNITLTAVGGSITTEELSSSSGSNSGNSGNGGAITLTATGGSITTEELSSSSGSDSSNSGNAGNITLNAFGGDITTDDLFASSSSDSGNSGNGGNIQFTARGGSIRTGSGVRISSSGSSSDTGSSGNGGSITFTAIGGSIFSDSWLDSSSSAGSFLTSASGDSGDGGNITFTATGGSISTDRLDSFSASTFGKSGNGGNIILVARDGSISTDALNSSSDLYFGDADNSRSSRNGGAITLTAIGNIRINGIIFGSSAGPHSPIRDASGPLTINTVGTVSISRNLSPNGADIVIGNSTPPRTVVLPTITTLGGNFSLITSDSIAFRDTYIISSKPNGNSGSITIRTPETLLLNQSQLFTSVESGTTGAGGNITVDAGSVRLSNFALIDTVTSSTGNAGRVNIRARDFITLTNRSTISTATTPQATGNGGNILLTAGRLSVTGGSQLQAFTQGTGNSGNIAITAGGVIVAGIGADGAPSGVFTSTGSTNSGRGGNITVTTPGTLRIGDRAVFSAETRSAAPGGNISVRAESMELANGGQLLASTVGRGRAGNITVDATNVIISGSNPNPNSSQPSVLLCNVEGRICGTSFDSNIEFSTRIPHVSVFGLWEDGVDEYSVTVTAPGTQAVFDIDNGGSATLDENGQIVANGLSGIDTTIFILNSEGAVLASNDNADAFLGDGGSTQDRSSQNFLSSRDSYLRYVFSEPGTYLIRVVKEEGIFERTRQYTLQISLGSPVATGSVVDANSASGLFARTQAAGAAGSITVNAPRLTIQNGAQINASTGVGSLGRGGNIIVNAPDLITLRGNSELSVETNGASRAGDVTLTTNNLTVEQAARITATATANATTTDRGGSITLNASEMNLAGTVGVFSETQGITPAGTLTLRPNGDRSQLSINLQDGAQISASTSGSGRGGNLILTAPDAIAIRGSGQLAVETRGAGDAGDVTIATNTLTLSNGASISATAARSAAATAQGGNIQLNVDRLNLFGANTGLFAETRGAAPAGGLRLAPHDSQRLSINFQGGARISAATFGSGRGGNLSVTAPTAITLQGNGRLSAASTGRGNAGSLTIATDTLTLRNGTRATVNSEGTSTAGNLEINAGTVSLSNGVRLSAETESGSGGNLQLRGVENLSVQDSEISASTEQGQGGRLTIASPQDPATSISVRDGSRIVTEATGTGAAGDMDINTATLSVANSQISVSSPNGAAGNLRVMADTVQLDRGVLSAETGVSRGQAGANIRLQQLDALLLQNGSQISARAGDRANGGNVTIDTANGFTIATPQQDNDIIASAAQGQGGNIQITTQGIFGLQQGIDRPGNLSNDIDASSQFGVAGTISVNRLEVDPSQGLTELPQVPIDVAGLVDQTICRVTQGSEFVVTGRGGLPASPNETLTGEAVWEDWRLSAVQDSAQATDRPPETTASISTPAEIVEAQGWVVSANGKVMLTAAGTAVSERSTLVPPVCQRQH